MEFADPRLLFWLAPASAIIVVLEVVARRPRGAVLRATVRILAIGALLAGLAGPRRGVISERAPAPIVPLIDVSDSVGEKAVGRAMTDAAEIARRLPKGAVTPPVFFAGSARAAREDAGDLAQGERARLGPDRSRLCGALQAAAASAGARDGARVLIFSDGRVDDAREAADLAHELSLRIDVADLGGANRPDARAVSLRLPDRVEESVPADVLLVATANTGADAVARLTVDGAVVAETSVRLEPGVTSSAVFRNVSFERGDRLVVATIEIPGDDEPRNDAIRSTVSTLAPPRFLVVAKPRGVSPFESALRTQGLEVDRWDSLAPLRGKDALAPYAALIVCDLPEDGPIGSEDAAILRDEVLHRGLGVLLVGSPAVEQSIRDGAPLAPISPVRLVPIPEPEPEPPPEEDKPPPPPEEKPPPPDPKPKTERPKEKKERIVGSTLTLLLLVDKSGSMSAGERLELARASAQSTAEALDPSDVIGVMAFDESPRWIVPFVAAREGEEVRRGLRNLTAGGRTRFFPALVAARDALLTTKSRIKHLVFITDGEPEDSFENYRALATGMTAQSITLSVIGVGEALGNTKLLGDLADWGNGRSYVDANFSEVPQMVIKETSRVLSTANALREIEEDQEDQEDEEAADATAATEKDAPPIESPDRFASTDAAKADETSAAATPPERNAPKPPSPSPPSPAREYPVTVRGPVPFLAGIDPASLPPVRSVLRSEPKAATWSPIGVDGEGPLFALRVAGSGSVMLVATSETEEGAGAWLEFPPLGKLLAQALRGVARGVGDWGGAATGTAIPLPYGPELAHVGPDREALVQLAAAGGGELVSPDRVEATWVSLGDGADPADPAPYFLVSAFLLLAEFLLRRRAGATAGAPPRGSARPSALAEAA